MSIHLFMYVFIAMLSLDLLKTWCSTGYQCLLCKDWIVTVTINYTVTSSCWVRLTHANQRIVFTLCILEDLSRHCGSRLDVGVMDGDVTNKLTTSRVRVVRKNMLSWYHNFKVKHRLFIQETTLWVLKTGTQTTVSAYSVQEQHHQLRISVT